MSKLSNVISVMFFLNLQSLNLIFENVQWITINIVILFCFVILPVAKKRIHHKCTVNKKCKRQSIKKLLSTLCQTWWFVCLVSSRIKYHITCMYKGSNVNKYHENQSCWKKSECLTNIIWSLTTFVCVVFVWIALNPRNNIKPLHLQTSLFHKRLFHKRPANAKSIP